MRSYGGKIGATEGYKGGKGIEKNTILFRKSGITSSSLSKLSEPVDPALIAKLEAKGWKIDIAKPGSDDLRWLNYQNAEACINSGVPKHVLIREGATKSALLEEILHAKQLELGLLEKYGSYQALEVHVKDFMLRHAEILGLNNKNDIALLQRLKIEEINRLNKL